MSMLGTKQPGAADYKDGRTKQAFKDETDVNKLLRKAQKVGSISHLQKFEGHYGDYAAFDFQDAQNKIAGAESIFSELPSEVRREFQESPAKFFEFVNDSANIGRLAKLLPAIAEPGKFFPDVRPTAESMAVADSRIAEAVGSAVVAPVVAPEVGVEDTGGVTG